MRYEEAGVEIDVATLAKAHADGAVVIDVRQPDEYVAGHVPGARLVPLGELAARLGELPPNERLNVICASGHRSLQAAHWLIAEGYDAVSVAGGTIGWYEAGLPIDVGPDTLRD